MDLVQEIDKAIVAHSMWKNHLKEAIDTGKFDTPVATVRTNNQCAFGKWLHGPSVTADVKGSPHYKTVIDLHTQFHKVAADILQLALAGKKEEATKLMAFGSEYMSVSSKLTAAMTEWKKTQTTVPAR